MSGFVKDSKRPSGGSLAANHRKEDSRLKVGVKSKTTSSNPLRPKKHLAWYVAYNPNPLEKKLSGVPQIKWKCPPKLNLDPEWRVASGEESSEVQAQRYRETTVMEAVYPHPSAIPPSPSISSDMEGKHDDERLIPLIPIVPIEETGAIEMPFSTSAPVKTFNCHSTPEGSSSVSPNPQTGEQSLLNILHGLEGRDLAIAAGAAAVAAALQSKQEMDTELLVKFLTNPEMMKTLVNKTEIGANSAVVPVAMNQPTPIKESAIDLGVIPVKHQPVSIKESASVVRGTPAKHQPIPTKEPASDLGATPLRSLSVPINESTSELSVPPAKRACIRSQNLVNNWRHAPLISNSHPPPIQDLTNGAREPEIARLRMHGATGTNEARPLTIPTASCHENRYERMVNQYTVPNAAPILPLYPSFLRPNSEAASQPMHPPPFVSGIRPVSFPPPFPSTPLQPMHPPPFFSGIKPVSFPPPFPSTPSQPMHPPPFFSGIKPVSFPPPFPSTPRPYLHCLTDRFRAPDHSGVRPCVGPSPPIPSALGVNIPSTSCSTFRPCPLLYPYMNRFPPPEGDFTYLRTLIKQHGGNHKSNEVVLPNHGQQPFNNLHEQCTNPLQTNLSVQKPCMYINSSKGCRNGSNCRYMHG